MMIARKKQDKVVRSARMRNESTKPKRERNPKRWFFIFSVIAFCAGVFYVFFCSHFVDVKQVEVRGTRRVESDIIRDSVHKLFEGQVFWCVRKNNYFFLSRKHITDKLREDQRIKNIQIEKKFPHTIIIDVEEYDIVPVWCVQNVCYELNDGCVAQQVDLSSARIQQNPHYIILDRGHDHVDIGQCVITKEDLHAINYLGKELIYAMNVGVTQPYMIDARGSREVRYATDESWDILISLSQDVQVTLASARLFTTKITLPIARKDLAYVDLRFPEKIFYKPKDGVVIEGDASEEESIEEEGDEKINDAHD